MIILIVMITLIAVFLEYRKLIKKGKKRELKISAVILSIGIALSAVRISGMNLPSPFLIIRFVALPISRLVSMMLS